MRHQSVLAFALAFMSGAFFMIGLGEAHTYRNHALSYTTIRGLEYSVVGGRSLKLDLDIPSGVAPPNGWPLIVAIPGGGWLQGSRAWRLPSRMANRGYLVARIDYRKSDEAIYPAQIIDCNTAVRFLRAHAAQFNIDPDRIGAWGISSGAHLASLVGTTATVAAYKRGGYLDQSSRLIAVLDWYGPTDFLQMAEHLSPEAPYDPNAWDSAECRLIGCAPHRSLQDYPAKVLKANPIRFVTGDDAAFLIQHGDRDDRVPLHQSKLLAEALRGRGVTVFFDTVVGAGHGGTLFKTAENYQRIDWFFDKYLMNR